MRSSRTRSQVRRLEPTMTGQSYHELKKNENVKAKQALKMKNQQVNSKVIRPVLRNNNKKVRFLKDETMKLELCHNMIHQTLDKKNENFENLEYEQQDAVLMTRLIGDLRHQLLAKGKSFAQQYILQKGLKRFGKKGYEATRKELIQLIKRNCFEPISVKSMTGRER